MSLIERYGGCLCGAIRYRLSGNPNSVGHCHCRICQKSTGSAMVTWASYPQIAFQILQGNVTKYASSSVAQRWFCNECGTALAFIHQEFPEEIDITVCSLDEPDSLQVDYHIWTTSQRLWLSLNDSLPRYPNEEP